MTAAEKKFESLLELSGKPCECGKVHSISLKKLIMHEGALSRLPEAVNDLGEFKKISVISDENTYEAAGREVGKLVPSHAVVLDPKRLHANEKGVEQAESMLDPAADLLIAAGSGTVHDITRYIAYQRQIPFISVPTAASVDGFVSTVAAMTWNGVKRTLTAVGPTVMVADSGVMKLAPKALTAAGVGDLLGKYTALADWKIGRILTGEPYCQKIVDLEEEAVEEVVRHIDDIAKGDANAIETLQYALVLSGLAMQMAGNSRPASGAEHHISHLIEMHVLNGEKEAFHGEKVGVATGLVLDEYRALGALSKDCFRYLEAPYADEAEIRSIFGPLGDEIVKENRTDPLGTVTEKQLKENWGAIQAILTSLPSGDRVRALIRAVGGSTSLSDLGLPESMKEDLFRISPLVRNRLTAMRIRNRLERV